MKNRFNEIMDGLSGVNLPSPLQKITCNACGLMTKRRDMVAEFGICAECYMSYAEDERMIYGERSESEEYRIAH